MIGESLTRGVTQSYEYWKDKLLPCKLIQLQYHAMGSPYHSGETEDGGDTTGRMGNTEIGRPTQSSVSSLLHPNPWSLHPDLQSLAHQCHDKMGPP